MPRASHAGAELYYEVSGEGPALVFAHGAGGNTLSWWQQVPFFARSHTVVTFDHRCFGRSICRHEDFHPRHFAGDLLTILDACGVERAALVCQSLGGWTGLPTALRHPERVGCLVLAGTPGGILTENILAAMAGMATRLDEEGIRGNAALAPDFPARRPDLAHLYDRISGLNTGLDPRLLARIADEAARIVPEALADYRVPTLFLAGEQDLLFPIEALREVAGLVPGAEWESFSGVGHSIYFEAPERFNAAVQTFLSKTPAAT